MDKVRSIFFPLLVIGLLSSAVAACWQLQMDRPSPATTAWIEKRRVTVGAILFWISCFGVMLAALLGELGLWAGALALYGSYFFPMLIIRVHVPSPRDRYLIRGWLALPFVVLLILLVVSRI